MSQDDAALMSVQSAKVEFPNPDGELLAGRLDLPPSRPRAMALFAHCFTCGKDVAAAGRIGRALAMRGFGVLRFDFTGLGSSEGDFANTDFSSNVGDLVAAADWLRERYEAPSLLVGHSLGGAATLAAAPRIPEARALATIGAPSDPAHLQHLFQDELPRIHEQGSAVVRLGGREFTIRSQLLRDLEERSFRPALRRLGKAVLILHSPVDEIVGIDHARALYEALRHPKSFITLDDADHLLSRKQDSLYVAELLTAWASRYLPPPPESAARPVDVLVEGRGSAFAQRVTAGAHVLAADEPLEVGGQDSGPSPYDLLLAALGTCTSMTLGMYARRKDWPLEQVAVRLEHDRIHAEDCADCETKEGHVDRIRRSVALQGDLDEAQKKRLLEIADRCPVHRTLTGEIRIETRMEDRR